MDLEPASHPIAFAHRGARSERRENTLEAFERAIELGATGLETDAWLTEDGMVVLDHDGVTGGFLRRRPISRARRTELAAHVPTLEDLYAQCGVAFELSIDVKDPGAFAPILEVARAAGAEDRLWLCHGDKQVLAAWRGVGGTARLVQSTRQNRIREGVGVRARSLAASGVECLNLRHDDWSQAAIAEVHRAGLRAFGWGAQSEESIGTLLRAGADGVYSDHVDRMVRVLSAISEPAETVQRPDPDERPPDDEALRDGSEDA